MSPGPPKANEIIHDFFIVECNPTAHRSPAGNSRQRNEEWQVLDVGGHISINQNVLSDLFDHQSALLLL